MVSGRLLIGTKMLKKESLYWMYESTFGGGFIGYSFNLYYIYAECFLWDADGEI